MNLFVSLRYLVALDDHKHFGRAALDCHVTQPALSNALRALEEGFGTAIVKRGRSFAGFTDEGRRILLSARRMLHEHELLQQDLNSGSDAPVGHLVIGSVPTAMPIAARFVAMLQTRHAGIVPTLRSMSSVDLEAGLESLALDMGLGYAERAGEQGSSRHASSTRGDAAAAGGHVVPQYTEHYFLLRKSADTTQCAMRIGAPVTWAEAATLPLCLLTAEMHNRTIVDRAFASVGAVPRIAIETNSILALALSVVAGSVCSVMPGALVSTVQGYPHLEALPLVDPDVAVSIAFRVHATNRPSRTLKAALAYASDPEWLRHAEQHAGAMSSSSPIAIEPFSG